MNEQEIFLQALKRSNPADRLAHLAQACEGRLGLRERVEVLLGAHERAASGFLESPAAGSLATLDLSPLAEKPGTVIGPYKLLQEIGEGGMGVVYMAEQERPVRRRVALKIIKPGMDSRQVIARFEAERQALAMMDHQNIAKILDAGVTGEPEASASGSGYPPAYAGGSPGRPYFVMELVHGVPITEFCEDKTLTMRERLELFVPVCFAVQHAHQKGIIHRDIKPSNVLVTMYDDKPVPKVIDFGVAKAVEQRLTEKTLFTHYGTLVGTFEYMSPEQAEMNAFGVDTRSDIYSLGVLLYELLTGTTPFDKKKLSNAGLDEMRRMIREDEPETVSARIARTRSAGRGARSESNVPRSEFRVPRLSELDWIVMKALEKDRTRRYESASALAADIQRYLSDEPVLACPPTTMYRFQKFARKHKPALATAAAIALCLILGTTVSAWQAVRATTAEAQANANANQAQEKAQEAATQRDEAQKQRDEVQALADKLAAKELQLQRTLYAAHMNLAQRAWAAGASGRVDELLDKHRPQPGEADLRGFEWHYLHKLCHEEQFIFKKPHARNWSLSPDGKRLALGGGMRDDNKQQYVSGEVTVLDLQTGQELWTRKAHASLAISAIFSPDATRLASVAWDSTLKVWDAATGQELRTLTVFGPSGGIWSVAFSPDGKRLACSGAVWDATQSKYVERLVKVLAAESGEELLSLKGAADWVDFSPDGKRLAGVDRSEVKVWDPQTGQELLKLSGGDYMADFSPDGKKIASGPKVFDLETGRELLSFDGVRSVSFSRDGKRLVGLGSERKVFDAESGKELSSIPVKGNRVAVSPDGKRLAVGGQNGEIQLCDAETGVEIRSFNRHAGPVQRMMFIQNGARLISLGGGTVRIWDASGKLDVPTFSGAAGWVRSVCFSPNGKQMAGVTRDSMTREHAIRLWDAQTGQEILALKESVGDKQVLVVTISPDGKRLAAGTGTYDQTKEQYVAGEVKVWDAQTGRDVVTLTGHTWPVVGLAFSPDSSRLVSCASNPRGFGSGDRGKPSEVKVWDVASGQESLALAGHTSFVESAAYNPDGKRLATLSRDNTVKVWDAHTGRELLSLPVLVTSGGGVAFSPDGKRLATSNNSYPAWSTSQFGEIKLWDAQSGKQLLTLQGHTVMIQRLVFSPDGRRLASTGGWPGESRELKVWDAESGEELLTFEKPGGNGIAFSPDGYRLVTAGTEGLKIYDATPLPNP